MDEVFETITKKLELAQQKYKTAINQKEFIWAQFESINDHIEDLNDEIAEYSSFLKNYEKNKGQA